MKKENGQVIRRRVVVRRSPVHGRGVFALRILEAGERIFEYKGERIAWTAAIREHGSNGIAGHTYFFGLSDGRVIDGGRGGNSARWLNHACTANCEAVEIEDRVFIHASTAIGPGEELFLDYQLAVDDPTDEETRLSYVCRCGTRGCRGTMLGVGAS
ncbi:SET domain-containing protein [Burkholderia sp. USMB20]|uniref:SET domain-containing protein n=1 Tax=Burkholderia sp. USMB20 TaxID=1571773 RepID=UPI0005CF3E82|nr:SET domain-containing protein-lysine N-methyltransferase [Burkholderia sp. USMB20]TGN95801.1 SET domain-containing protein [Burkholderia sp. USMB20]